MMHRSQQVTENPRPRLPVVPPVDKFTEEEAAEINAFIPAMKAWLVKRAGTQWSGISHRTFHLVFIREIGTLIVSIEIGSYFKQVDFDCEMMERDGERDSAMLRGIRDPNLRDGIAEHCAGLIFNELVRGMETQA